MKGAIPSRPNPVATARSSNSAVADAYRVLRTNLIFTSADPTGPRASS